MFGRRDPMRRFMDKIIAMIDEIGAPQCDTVLMCVLKIARWPAIDSHQINLQYATHALCVPVPQPITLHFEGHTILQWHA